VSRVDHLDLTVGSLEASLPFYRELLGPLGWRWVHEVEGERSETIRYLFRRDGRDSIGLREAQTTGDGSVDRYAPGLHHIAFDAGSRRAVDRAAEWARRREVEIESEPQGYAYSPGYYALFLRDPDGIKVEIMTKARLRTLLWALRPATTPFRPANRGRPR
jgi:catechol 2,3-dioxygenase-like lactoylglutathione lyase family enzyme